VHPVTAPYNHSPQARFDDAVLPDAAAMLAALASWTGRRRGSDPAAR
jgi:hypothetical protein